MRRLSILFIIFVVFFLTVAYPQTIRYVMPVSQGLADGSSWANASDDLQLMINSSATNDMVWVAAGTYKPRSNDRNNSFVLKTDVKIYGGFAGTENYLGQRDWNANLTVLSGDIGVENDTSDNCCHVVVSSSAPGTKETMHLDGFTITGGNANIANYMYVNGGAVYQYMGGGIYNTGPRGSSLILTNIIITENHADRYGGGMCNNYYASAVLTNVIISKNSANIHNGGITNFGTSSIVLNNVIIVDNYALFGGGIGNGNLSTVLSNVTIAGNRADSLGGGMYCSAYSEVHNCILYGNTSPVNSNICNYKGTAITNYYNSLIEGSGGSGIGWDTNSGIDYGGNIDADPMFVDAANGNYRLKPCSPAIDAGNNTYVSDSTDMDGNPRIYNGTVDMGAYEHQGGAEYISAQLSSTDTVICYGDTAIISFAMPPGIAPWLFIYTTNNGKTYDTIENITDTFFYLKVNPLISTTYRFVELWDKICIRWLTDTAQINVVQKLTPTNSLSNDTLCDGEKTKAITFSGAAHFYEWKASKDAIDSIPTGIQTGNFGEYMVNNKGNTVLTSIITVVSKYYTSYGKVCQGDTSFSITVLPIPTINNLLENDTLCDNEQTKGVNFSGAAHYKWTANGAVSGIPSSGTGNFGKYAVTNKTANRTKSTIKVTPQYILGSKECTGTEQSFEVVAKPATIIESINSNTATLCEKDSLRIEVIATGENIVYQWYKDNSILSGENSRSFFVSSVNQNHNGKYYVKVGGICGDAISETISIDASGANVLAEKWEDVILVDNSKDEFIGYQWYKDGRIIDGATEQFYQEIGGLNGCYSVELRLAAGGRMRSCEHCVYNVKKSNEVYVYPNPTNNQLIISLPNPSEGKASPNPSKGGEYDVNNIEIYDIVGRKVGTWHAASLQSDIGNQTSPTPSKGGEQLPLSPPEGGKSPLSFGEGQGVRLDISHLSAGLYFLKIQTDNGTITKKIIKN